MDKFWDAIVYLGTTRWYWLAYIMPSVWILIWFFRKNKTQIFVFTVAVLEFIRDSLKTDGRPDATKIIAFFVTNVAFIPVYLYCAYAIKEAWQLIWLVGVGAVFILVLLRIVLPAHLIELKNGKKE
jgi:energy-converting hydrogenase Eha subunit E